MAKGEGQWIWYPEKDPASVPAVTRYFRKTFDMSNPEVGWIDITCDDRYELWVNGVRIGGDDKLENLETYDIKDHLVSGTNVIAIKAENTTNGSAAGLFVRVSVRDSGNTDISHATDDSWLCNSYGQRGWQQPEFNDSKWAPVRALGPFGTTLPWKGKIKNDSGSLFGRFKTPRGFKVEQVVPAFEAGSVVCIAFNEKGDLIASRERGPLTLFARQADGSYTDQPVMCADQVSNCQGILPLNGQIYAIGKKGDTPAAFVRLSDKDADGRMDEAETLFEFKSEMIEHGPHAVMLGPEGLIYLMVGNHSKADMPAQDTSPYPQPYEGDIVSPKYEDPSGHAVGIKAPGGMVLRTDVEASFLEVVCGGLRNSYDLAIHPSGEMFVFDADMEWDVGLPWYRPARVLHVVSGGEYGWRSGWSKWPEYYIDNLPSIFQSGRGSPSGVDIYDHVKFPKKYRGAMIACDWSRGQILAVKLAREGASFEATSEVLVEGRPLNATDTAVGPDGHVYFSTGGRDSEGGIFRIVYDGDIDAPPKSEGVMAAVRQPQIMSAWGRDNVARIKAQLGDKWGRDLGLLVDAPTNPVEDRVRAMDLMQLVGPFPSKRFLVKLGKDKQPLVRAKAAYLMGLHIDPTTMAQLKEMLADKDPLVQRMACEALVRAQEKIPIEPVLELLSSDDVNVRFAAYRALQWQPPAQWRDAVLQHENPRVFAYGAAAYMVLEPDEIDTQAFSRRGRELMAGYVSDDDFLGLLRVFQLCVGQDKLGEKDKAELASELAEEYPSGDPRMNRELVRLIVRLQDSSALDRMVEMLKNTKEPIEERIHLAMHLRFLKTGWTPETRGQVLEFYENARLSKGGASLQRYLDNAARDYLTLFSAKERGEILAEGDKLPGMALQILRSCPRQLSTEQVAALVDLDQRVSIHTDTASNDLATGIAAVIGQSANPEGLEYLRKVFEKQPERRQDVAMVLSSMPTDDKERNKLNWPLLVRSLPVVEGVAGEMVLESLAAIRLRPVKPEPMRQVIIAGLRLGSPGNVQAVKVLEHWTGKKQGEEKDDGDKRLAAWQSWFHDQYPDSPKAELPKSAPNSRWNFPELMEFLASDDGQHGDPEKGKALFMGRAQCAKCHRHGAVGESIGPDLSTVSSRFQKKEILESILHPSQVISDQYLSRIITTNDGKTYTGIVGSSSESKLIILQADGKKVELDTSDVDTNVVSPKSSMPEGLIDSLSDEEVADLFSFLLEVK